MDPFEYLDTLAEKMKLIYQEVAEKKGLWIFIASIKVSMYVYRLHKDLCVFKNHSIVFMILWMACQSLFVCETGIKENKLNFGV